MMCSPMTIGAKGSTGSSPRVWGTRPPFRRRRQPHRSSPHDGEHMIRSMGARSVTGSSPHDGEYSSVIFTFPVYIRLRSASGMKGSVLRSSWHLKSSSAASCDDLKRNQQHLDTGLRAQRERPYCYLCPLPRRKHAGERERKSMI